MKSRDVLKAQRGIAVITLIIFVVILLGVLMAMVAMSRTTSASTVDQAAKLLASAIIDQGNLQKTGFDLLASQGNDINSIVPKETGTGTQVPLYGATQGGTVRQIPPGDALSSGALGKWLYATPAATAPVPSGIQMPEILDGGIASSATAKSYGVVLTGVKDAVCKQINAVLRNYEPNSAIPASGIASPTPATSPNGDYVSALIDLSDTTFTGVKEKNGGSEPTVLSGYAGCVSTSLAGAVAPNQNIYFNIIKPM